MKITKQFITAFKPKRTSTILALTLISISLTSNYTFADDDDDDVLFLITGPLGILLFDEDSDDDDIDDDDITSIYDAFGDNVDVVIDGDEVVFEATGQPDHKSAYWDPSNALYIAPDESLTTVANMSPGTIDQKGSPISLRVDSNPSKASSSTATSLGAVGIAVTGVPIYNDQEGPNVNLDTNVMSGFDHTGGHVGPTDYHYHLEPFESTDVISITFDSEELVGVIADGFFLYGRKCNSTGTYPTDLDGSGGHTSSTQYTNSDYHYHIEDAYYLNDQYYLLFPGDYQGTPSNIN